MKKFYRNSDNEMIGGVCSGMAKYMDIDPTIVRVLWAVSTLFYGIGGILYILLWIIAPTE